MGNLHFAELLDDHRVDLDVDLPATYRALVKDQRSAKSLRSDGSYIKDLSEVRGPRILNLLTIPNNPIGQYGTRRRLY